MINIVNAGLSFEVIEAHQSIGFTAQKWRTLYLVGKDINSSKKISVEIYDVQSRLDDLIANWNTLASVGSISCFNLGFIDEGVSVCGVYWAEESRGNILEYSCVMALDPMDFGRVAVALDSNKRIIFSLRTVNVTSGCLDENWGGPRKDARLAIENFSMSIDYDNARARCLDA